MRYLVPIAVFIIVVAMAQMARSAACEAPREPVDVAGDILAQNPAADLHALLEGAEALAFIARLNDYPPQTAYEGDTVVVLRHPTAGQDFVILMLAGCPTIAGPVGRKVVNLALGGEQLGQAI